MSDNKLETLGNENEAAVKISAMQNAIEGMAGLMQQFVKSAQRQLHPERDVWTSGNTKSLNFEVMSIYVDNSQNANPVTIQSNTVSFTVGANTQEWIHPLGGRHFDLSTTAASPVSVPVVFVDTFLPIK